MARELQTLNEQNKLALWAERVNACRSSGRTVKDWCKESGICEQTYYRWQKRLESGSFQWPRKESEARSLTAQQYRWLMEGLSIDQPKAHKMVSGLEIV